MMNIQIAKTIPNSMNCCILISLTFLCLPILKAQDPPDYYVDGVSRPLINLNGTWKINLDLQGKFWTVNELTTDWKDIQVPGECMMQGFPIRHDQPFVYKREFEIPDDFKGKIIKVRFEGVYSYARVWVNGKYICDHSGGFTAWDCDITSVVNPGTTAFLTVEVTDRADEISYGSGYAKHPIGGILRNVSLVALPATFPEQLFITTDLDREYRDALLLIEGRIRKKSNNSRIKLDFSDQNNHNIELEHLWIDTTDSLFRLENEIKNPLKWDAEHPNLYQLKISFLENGKVTWYKNYKIGFREIEIKGNRFLVNGQQVKLRGVCRHDIHPLLGRVSTPEYELQDVLLAKEANINFIRTSHYPPSDHFLQLCDEYGIYVEDETAVCFVGSHRTAEYYPGNSENDPTFTGRYLSQLNEMVYAHRNHPSILFWSIGNENMFGSNFKKSYDWVKSTDPTRPVIFSYPGHVPDRIRSYDLISMHYPGIDGNMEQYGITTVGFGHKEMPVIFDEWAHVACYNNFTVKEDPNIRNFWGISLDSMWQKTFDSDGGLGGAIWGMIDETFMLPADLPGFNEWWGKIDPNVIPGEYTGNAIGYGEWGIIDTWRRKKPEFWNVKKAYSPAKILQTEFFDYIPGNAVKIPVYNRFDFTNLNELKIHCSVNGITFELNAPDIPPRSRGILLIPVQEWPSGELLSIDFFDQENRLIDSSNLSNRKEENIQEIIMPEVEISLSENKDQYTISCENGIIIYLDKNTGLFQDLDIPTNTLTLKGPFLNVRTKGETKIYSSHSINEYGTGWKLKTLSVQKIDHAVEISIIGDYNILSDVKFQIMVFADGTINTTYTVENLPDEYIRELGVKYMFDNIFDTLSWERNSYWSKYPSDHLSAKKGKVFLFASDLKEYREPPGKVWRYDTKSFFYEGIQDENSDQLSMVAKATKENIFAYSLQLNGMGSIAVAGDGQEGCRIDKQGNHIFLYINNELDYPDLSWGNFQRNIKVGKAYQGTARIKINPE